MRMFFVFCLMLFSSAGFAQSSNTTILPKTDGGKVVIQSTTSGGVASTQLEVDTNGVKAALWNNTSAVATGSHVGLSTSYAAVVRSSVKSATNENYTLLENDGYQTIVFSTGSTNRVFTVASSSVSAGRRVTVIKSDAGTGYVDIIGVGGANNNRIYKQYGHTVLVCDGTSWFYEEGITENGQWPQVVMEGDTSNPSNTYMVQASWFRRVGDLVTVHATVKWSNSTGGSGNIVVADLPYSPATNAMLPLYTETISFSGTPIGAVAYIAVGSTKVRLYGLLNGANPSRVALSSNQGSTNRQVDFTGSYGL